MIRKEAGNMTAIEDDLARIALQEEALQFKAFNLTTAWELGALLCRMAQERQLGVAIDIQLHSMPAFFVALPGSTADNTSWVRRKRNTVLRLFRSSYATGLTLASQHTTLEEKLGLPSADYAAHGGSFPIVVSGTGCIGAVTVSGLPQRDDHNIVVEALATLLARDWQSLRLSAS
jgi:uncharacterized protein (UPF0303 family)